MIIVIALLLLSVGAVLILASLFRPSSVPGAESLRYDVQPARARSVWMMGGGLILALGGTAILLLTKFRTL